MADLNDRGQILLIAAFTLAVAFVALALVVNSAIFTENLASRGEVAGSSEAIAYQHQVERSVGAAIGYVNVHNESDLAGSLRDSISDLGTAGGTQQARSGTLVNVSYVNHATGTRLADNASGGSTFENESGDARWQLARNVDATRAFVITTEPGDIPSSGSPFRVEANESVGNVWELEVWESGSEVVAHVNTASGDDHECRVDVSGVGEFQIDVTGGVVAGERCHALTRAGSGGTPMWLANGLSASYELWFENGDGIRGNYSMVIQGTINATHVAAGPNVGDPFHTPAVYDATVDYVYVTPNVRYEAEIEVVPGEAGP